jgi:endo-beta-N-acetylglucosaminidase D
MDSLLMWFKDGVPTDLSRLRDLEFKRSHVRPRAVIVDRATQLDTSIDPRRSVFANLPIGGSDLLTGLPSGNFDEDVFSAWPYVKIHGNWSNPWFTAPAAYTDAAHKHGVSVLSSWFFAWNWLYEAGKTKAEDANSYKVELMTKKNEQGKFIYAEPMINIMQYFGMDGVNYNSECFFQSASDDIKALHNELYRLARAKDFSSFHIGWYNSVENDGVGPSHGSRWRLDNTNNEWHYHNEEFVSDAFMLDYNWNGDELKATVNAAKSYNLPNGALDVYAGMWLVKIHSSYFPALDEYKEVSIGLWGEHKMNRFFQHRSGLDLKGVQKSYQDKLEWFFSGKTQNPKDARNNTVASSANGVDNDSYLQDFHGIAKHVAERSTVQGSLPFASNFNLGNGLAYYDRGVKTLGSWYNLSAQDMTPTYRWLITDTSGRSATNVKARFSHDDAWIGGSALLLEGTAKATPTDVTLYRARLSAKKNSAYSTKPATPMDFTIEPVNECATLTDLKMVWSMSNDNRKRLVYNDEVNVDHFEIWLREAGKDPKMVAHTASWAHYLPKYEWPDDKSATFEVGVRAVAQDLATTSDMAWRTVTRNPAAADVACAGGGAYCEAVNDLGQAAEAHFKRYFDSAYTVGADADIKVYGQPPATLGLEGYAAFLSDTIKVTAGKSFIFRAEAIYKAPGQTTDSYSMQWNKYRVYVDWNGDGEFDPDTEMEYSGGKDNSGDISVCHLNFAIEVPVNAVTGVTRMRIRYADAWVAHPGACGLAAGGYTADFCILVAGDAAASDTPDTSGAAAQERPAFSGAALNTPYPNAYLVYKLHGGAAGSASNLYLLLKKKGAAAPTAYPLNAATAAGWNEVNIPLRDLSETDTIVSIGLRVKSEAGDEPLKAYVGELKLLPGSFEPQKITVSAAPVITAFDVTSSVLTDGADMLVAYGAPLEFTFKVAEKIIALEAAVTVNDVPTACTYDTATDKYTVRIPSVTEAQRIAIVASAPCFVAVEKSAVVEVVSASGPEIEQLRYGLASGSAFTLRFRVNGKGYDVPKVMIGKTTYPLSAANDNGVYTVTTGAITADTVITITTSLRRFAVSVTAGSHVALQTSAHDTLEWGSSCEVRFTLSKGYDPVVTINGLSQPAPAAGSGGVYTVAVSNVTSAVTVDVSAAIQQLDVTLSRDGNVALQLGAGVGRKKVNYGGSYPFAFKVIAGYLPVVKVNGKERPVGAPDSTGLYCDTLHSITVSTTVEITTKPKSGNGETPTGVPSVAKGMPRFYPNPVSHVLTFVNTDKVSIYAVTGALIGVYTTATVNVAHLPAGVYMVTMQRGSYTKTAKLIKK